MSTEYRDDALVPKNTNVIAKRVPPTFGGQPAIQAAAPPKPVVPGESSVPTAAAGAASTSSGPPAAESEQDKINAIIAGAGSYVAPATGGGPQRRGGAGGAAGAGPQRPPPPGYVCYRCGQPGHFIQHCPTNGDPRFDVPKVKRAHGIPRSFLQEIKEGKTPENLKDMKGVVRLPDGTLAKVRPDEETFKRAVATVDNPNVREETPTELQCPICELLLDDAVLIPCCGNSFCAQCMSLLSFLLSLSLA